jgi:hypothetical protein
VTPVGFPVRSRDRPGQVELGPGTPRLVMFFATWLTEVTDLRSVLTGGNAHVAMARRDGLPQPLTGSPTPDRG